MVYILSFLAVFILSFLFSSFFFKVAKRYKIIDRPKLKRKIHKKPIPLLGGLAVFFAAFIVIGVLYFVDRKFILGNHLFIKNIFGIFIGGAIIMFGGFLDDKYDLKPKFQIIFPIIAAVVIIAAGLGIRQISNPFGGMLNLAQYEWILLWHNGIAYRITLFADLFTFIWIMGMMYTTKFLDGLDGLVSGIGAIGSVIIFALSLTSEVNQPETALLALIFSGACLGFLIWGWHPAKIFLGEGGSLFIGFMLGSLAILSGSKISTTLLIIGLPVLDVLWVIIRRIFIEKKSPFSGDRKHFHHRLLDAGFSHKGAVLLLYFITASFGVSALFLQTAQRIKAFAVLIIVMLVMAITVITRTHLIKQGGFKIKK